MFWSGPSPLKGTPGAYLCNAMPQDESNAPVLPWRAALMALPAHSPPRILVAEDDPEMRRLVVEALREDGYDVLEARDGGRLLVELARELAAARGRTWSISSSPICGCPYAMACTSSSNCELQGA